MACWRTKAAICLKRVITYRKIECGGPMGTHQRSFERYHPRPLRPPLPQNWGCATPTENKRVTCVIRYVGERYDIRHGAGSGPKWWVDVNCTGRETDFTQCGQTGDKRRTKWVDVNCVHDDDIAISCFRKSLSRHAGKEVASCRSSLS